MSSATKAPGAEGPGDWVLVPREPTKEMLAALSTVGPRALRYQRMIASVPAPSDPAGAGGDLGELERLRRVNRDRKAILERIEELVASGRPIKRDGPEHLVLLANIIEWEDGAPKAGEEVSQAVEAIMGRADRSGQLVASTPGQKGAGEEKTGAWQPIETAPTEKGALLQLFEPHEVGGFQFVGCRGADGAWFNNLDHVRQKPTHWRPLFPYPPCVRDRSSEAAETSGSAGRQEPGHEVATPAQTPPPSATPEGDPPMTVEEARDILDPYFKQYSGGAQEALEFAKWMADRTADEEARNRFLATASRIELALRTLHAAGEVR